MLINDLLSSGEIPDLFPAEDVDSIVNNILENVPLIESLEFSKKLSTEI